jgi:hypothetical protein
LTYTIGFAPPSLTVAKTAPAEVLLQWPTNYMGFTVESALSLDAPSLWQPMTNGVTVNGAVFGVSVSTTNAAQFFRLHKP